MLQLDGVSLTDGSQPISHAFAQGRISVILGRNASGKTRLARLVAGLERPAAGKLYLGGEDITARGPGHRSVALVYQAFVNYPLWTVYQNLASPLVAQRRKPDEVRDKVMNVARELQLEAYLERLPASLSGGQQQRVAIGRALNADARVLVMDEPLVNLDYKLREALTVQLRGLLAGTRLTVLYTSSDPRDAFALGDEVVLLADHGVVQSGTPLRVYENPASPTAVDLMSDPGANRLVDGDTLRVVRPEDLSLQRESIDDVSFGATILSRETNGAETYLHCAVADEHWVARLDGLVDAQIGARLVLFAARDCVFTFQGEARFG